MRDVMKVLICGVCAFSISFRAHSALPTLSGLAESFANLTERYSVLTNAIAESNSRLFSITSLVERIKASIEANKAMREKFHGGLIGAYVFAVTNETRVTPTGRPLVRQVRVDLYRDGSVWTNYPSIYINTKDPELEAKLKEESKKRDEEIRAAWERANLPEPLAKLREAQRKAMNGGE